MSIDTLIQYAEMDNIAEELNEATLTKLGQLVSDEYTMDKQSRQEWEERNKESMKLAAQLVETKSSPWPGASNVKFPLLTEAAMQFNARAYPALLNNKDIVKATIVGEDNTGEKMEAAIRVSRHMSYQLMYEMEEWEEEFDKLLMTLPIIGCMFKKSYYDPIKKRNRSDLVYPENLVVDYYTRNMDECPRATQIIPMTKNEIRIMVLNGIFLDVDLPDTVVTQNPQKQQLTGTTAPVHNSSTPRELLEQHRLYDLDEDGLEEPYIITVDKDTKKVLRVVAAYDAESIELSDEGEVINIPKISYFVKYPFIPNPDGSFYDIGFGSLLSPLNDTVDTLINQLIDSGTLYNNNSGFLARSFRTKGGNMRFKPFEWKTINVTGDDLKKSIFPLPVREPSGVLFQLLGMMINQAQRIASTVDSMVGENPGQNQKATTTMAVMEQGAKVFNAIHKRIHRALGKELRKLFVLNSKYLDGVQYFNIIDPRINTTMASQVVRGDYNPEAMNIVPASDSAAPTQQMRIAKAQALLELLPTGYIDQQQAILRLLQAMEIPGIEDILISPPPPQPDPKIELEKAKLMMLERTAERQFQLDLIKTQQTDLTTQTNAILALAKAEAAEEGSQIGLYKVELDTLIKASKALGEQAKQQQAAPQETDYTSRFMNGPDQEME